jgi:hypothetical protein
MEINILARHWWLTLATLEAEIKRIVV